MDGRHLPDGKDKLVRGLGIASLATAGQVGGSIHDLAELALDILCAEADTTAAKSNDHATITTRAPEDVVAGFPAHAVMGQALLEESLVLLTLRDAHCSLTGDG
jgi:hypothetical protein